MFNIRFIAWMRAGWRALVARLRATAPAARQAQYIRSTVAMQLVACGLLALGTLAGGQAHAQGRPELFTLEPGGGTRDLPQHQRVEEIRRRPTTAAITLVRVAPSVLSGAGTRMTIAQDKALDVDRTHADVRSPTDFTWFGRAVGVEGNATLVVHDGSVTGTIRDGLDLYRIEPVGQGLHAIVKIDSSRFPPEHPPGFQQIERRSLPASAPASASDAPDTGSQAAPQDIDVLVAYTPAARSAVSDIQATIQLAVAETNQSYLNSGVNIRIRLVDSFEVSYSESGKTYETILSDFTNMPAVLDRRNRAGADMSALIINQSDYCGMANAILAQASTAFAVVHYECATGYYSFGHELGHLQGARHDPANDPSTTPFAYGHGFQGSSGGAKWRTVMAYACPGGCPRLQYWSNPNVLYGGVPMGTASLNHNARVLNETAATIAAFRTTALPDYMACASERQTCSFSGTKMVAYGAADKFAYRRLTGGTACTNAVFGDPAPGVAKTCYVGADVYAYCASEGQTCSFTGTRNVAYGANGAYAYKVLTAGVLCSNATFGDPAPGVVKGCHVGPQAYVYCAAEAQNCPLSGIQNVAYGAAGRFVYKTLSGNVSCSNATFGDPAPGVAKACYVGPQGYTHCSAQNQTCSFPGTRTVAYGANGTFVQKRFTGAVACNDATFGDPAPGVWKACYVQ